MTSQRLSVKCVVPSATVWSQFEGGVLRSTILVARGVLAGLDLHQSKAHHQNCQNRRCEVIVVANAPKIISGFALKFTSKKIVQHIGGLSPTICGLFLSCLVSSYNNDKQWTQRNIIRIQFHKAQQAFVKFNDDVPSNNMVAILQVTMEPLY